MPTLGQASRQTDNLRTEYLKRVARRFERLRNTIWDRFLSLEFLDKAERQEVAAVLDREKRTFLAAVGTTERERQLLTRIREDEVIAAAMADLHQFDSEVTPTDLAAAKQFVKPHRIEER